MVEETRTYVLNFPFLTNKPRNINTLTLSCLDVSRVIKCLGDVCKNALQNNRDKDFKLLRFVLPHLKEAVKVWTKTAILVITNYWSDLGKKKKHEKFAFPQNPRLKIKWTLDLWLCCWKKNLSMSSHVVLDADVKWVKKNWVKKNWVSFMLKSEVIGEKSSSIASPCMAILQKKYSWQ